MTDFDKKIILIASIIYFTAWYWVINYGHSDLYKFNEQVNNRIYEIHKIERNLEKRINMLSDIEKQRVMHEL